MHKVSLARFWPESEKWSFHGRFTVKKKEVVPTLQPQRPFFIRDYKTAVKSSLFHFLRWAAKSIFSTFRNVAYFPCPKHIFPRNTTELQWNHQKHLQRAKILLFRLTCHKKDLQRAKLLLFRLTCHKRHLQRTRLAGWLSGWLAGSAQQ